MFKLRQDIAACTPIVLSSAQLKISTRLVILTNKSFLKPSKLKGHRADPCGIPLGSIDHEFLASPILFTDKSCYI